MLAYVKYIKGSDGDSKLTRKFSEQGNGVSPVLLEYVRKSLSSRKAENSVSFIGCSPLFEPCMFVCRNRWYYKYWLSSCYG